MAADGHITRSMWAAVALEWWFLGLVAYHLLLEHRGVDGSAVAARTRAANVPVEIEILDALGGLVGGVVGVAYLRGSARAWRVSHWFQHAASHEVRAQAALLVLPERST